MLNTIVRVSFSWLILGLVACGGMHPKGHGDDRPVGDGQSGATPRMPGPLRKPPGGEAPAKAGLGDPVMLARSERAKVCVGTRSAHSFSLMAPQTTPQKIADPDYVAIKETLKSACARCHGAPVTNQGRFSFLDSYEDQTLIANGTTAKYLGLASVAERMQDSVAAGRMPPEADRAANPEAFVRLGEQLGRWIAAQKPQQREIAPDFSKTALGLTDAGGFSDLGDCIPTKESVGTDAAKDKYFADAKALPDDLKATDFVSFDAAELGRLGTFAYDVEYPLWTDNAEKSRLIHVPAKGGVRQSVRFDGKKFDIPENTRFYKTFFRSVRLEDGSVVARPIETRLIVVRYAPGEPLFGTYVWDEIGRAASLAKIPYRNGSLWKDQVLNPVVDEAKNLTRKYAVPARHRCVECHNGAEDGSFTLGFSPLQINRRPLGSAASEHPVAEDELAQVSRLISFGVLSGVDDAHPLPKLEDSLGNHETRPATLRAQGYMVGNCSHCHNEKGYAATNGKVKLYLTAGKLFNFNTSTGTKQDPRFAYVDSNGDLARSAMFQRVHSPKASMPLDTPGGRDCRGVLAIARWIKSFDKKLTPAEVDSYVPENLDCTKNDPLNSGEFAWTEDDFTADPNAPFKPRRGDWADPVNGMTDVYRQLKVEPGLKQVIERTYAAGFWIRNPACTFPTYPDPAGLPVSEQRPWMFKSDGSLKQAWGELFYTTPGASLFVGHCAACHGLQGKGDGPTGVILNNEWAGKNTVPSFFDGMFGNKGENLKLFDQNVDGKTVNFAPNYMIWMAMEGTKVEFPSAAKDYIGPHGAQMLKQIRDRCARLIPSSNKNMTNRVAEYDIYHDICLYGNSPLTTPEIQYKSENALPLNPEAQDKWLDKATMNAGLAIFEYYKKASATGKWQPAPADCAKTDLSAIIPPRPVAASPATPTAP